MNGYKISVILPTYNRLEFIEDTINSIMNQTYKDFEIVIADDGSTDGTDSYIEELKAKNDNIIYDKAVHSGICNARNRAINLSGGDYLFFIDSDDFIHPMLFERMIDAVKKTGSAMASEYFCEVNSKSIKEKMSGFEKEMADKDFIYRNANQTVYDYFHKSPIDMIGGLLVNKDFAKNIKFDDRFIIGEDKLYVYYCVKNNADYVIIPQKWYYNRIHKGNASWDYSRKALLSRYMRRKTVWLSELELKRNENAVLQIEQGFSFLIEHFLRNKNLKELAFLSHIVKKDRKYFKLLKNKKHRILVFLISYFNPLLLFERNEKEFAVWKKSGLY